MGTDWIDAAALADVPDGDAFGVTVAGRQMALYAVEGSVYATDAMCTHGRASLCGGFLEGHEIECPLHQGRFDVRSGLATCAPAVAALQTYPVQLHAGRVLVGVPAGSADSGNDRRADSGNDGGSVT